MITAHGKTKDYLHRFKIIESPECTCKEGQQTVEHLIYECNKLEIERENLVNNITPGIWPVQESELITNYRKQFNQFISSIDFEVISSETATQTVT
jgi:hypothetical protein